MVLTLKADVRKCHLLKIIFKAKHKNVCFMIHEIFKYENIFILMEKMGKQYSQTPLKSPTMFRKYCVGVGEEGDLG